MKLNAKKARAILDKKCWTLKMLAAETDIYYNNLSKYFCGAMSIGEKQLKKIADALGVEAQEIILEESPKTESKEVQVFCPHCGKLITIKIEVSN